jgi:hypothetical protein
MYLTSVFIYTVVTDVAFMCEHGFIVYGKTLLKGEGGFGNLCVTSVSRYYGIYHNDNLNPILVSPLITLILQSQQGKLWIRI